MDGLLYMDAVITPNRSLSDRGFVALICFITLANCASAAVFVAMGAKFVAFFLGLDLAAVILAFVISWRSVHNVERVQVSSGAVRIIRETPRTREIVWESPTAFTRLDIETEDLRVVGVRLGLSGRWAQVAGALSPGERRDFAKALEAAIHKARQARF